MTVRGLTTPSSPSEKAPRQSPANRLQSPAIKTGLHINTTRSGSGFFVCAVMPLEGQVSMT